MKDRLIIDLKEAMKNKDSIRKNTIQSIRTAILQEEKDRQIELNSKDIENIIMKEKKKRIDALEQFQKANRQDLVEQTEKEIAIINEYLPKQLSKEELELEVWCSIKANGASSIKDMGLIVKDLKDVLGARVDSKTLSAEIKRQLSKL